MSNLPPLNSVKQCAKCLFQRTSPHIPIATSLYICGVDESKRPEILQHQITSRNNEHIPLSECMQRTCMNCGYHWFEQCADTPLLDSTDSLKSSVSYFEPQASKDLHYNNSHPNYPDLLSKEHLESANKISEQIKEEMKDPKNWYTEQCIGEGVAGSTLLKTNEPLNTTELISALNKAREVFRDHKHIKSSDCSIVLHRLKNYSFVNKETIDQGNILVKQAKELLLSNTKNKTTTLEGNYSQIGSLGSDD